MRESEVLSIEVASCSTSEVSIGTESSVIVIVTIFVYVTLERLSVLRVARGIIIIGCMYMEAAVEGSRYASELAVGAIRKVGHLRDCVVGYAGAVINVCSGDVRGGRDAVVHYPLYQDIVGL